MFWLQENSYFSQVFRFRIKQFLESRANDGRAWKHTRPFFFFKFWMSAFFFLSFRFFAPFHFHQSRLHKRSAITYCLRWLQWWPTMFQQKVNTLHRERVSEGIKIWGVTYYQKFFKGTVPTPLHSESMTSIMKKATCHGF